MSLESTLWEIYRRHYRRQAHHHEPVRLGQILVGVEHHRLWRRHKHMADITKNVGSTVHSIPIELNAESQPIAGLPVAANVQYSIDNTAVGTLTQNADGSADVRGIASGTVNLTWIDTSNPALAGSIKQLQFTGDTDPTALDQQLS